MQPFQTGKSVLENKPRKPWLAGLLSFFTIGLGHIYAGEAKKGISLYLGQGLILSILLLFLIIEQNLFVLLLSVIIGVAYFFFSLISAINTAKRNSVTYYVRKFNKWYVYLIYFVLANVVV